jgi:valyl-tRNA synthetase
VQIVLDEATVILPLAGVIDVAKEKTRLEREMARLDGEIAKFDRKLANDGFLKKAPTEVIEEQRRRRADAAQARAKLDQAHQRLAAL